MIKKAGETLSISLTVEDLQGGRVTDDTPYVNIKNAETNKYYNGLSWQETPFNLYMTHVSNGVYIYRWLLLYSGVFQVTAKSATYGTENTVDVNVFSEIESTYPWIKTEPYIVQFASGNSAASVQVSIQNANGEYWNGTEFVAGEIFNDMTKESPDDVVFTYSITFASAGKYTIFAKNSNDLTDSLLYMLNVLDSEDDVIPVTVAWNNLASLDGTDCLIIDEKGMPIKDLEVAAYNAATKQLANKCFTNEDGTWDMVLKPGRYTFMFTKPGYESEGFERLVS